MAFLLKYRIAWLKKQTDLVIFNMGEDTPLQ